jgi:ribonuclease HII
MRDCSVERVGGTDEAGRGCIVGPLVVAGVSIEQGSIKKLVELGVKDSKLLLPQKRELLYDEIKKLCEIASFHIMPQEIDEYVGRGKKYRKLNYLEAIYMARVVDRLNATRVYVDACDTNPRRFSEEITKMLASSSRIIAEHHADRNYPVVSAASIIAKVERDRAVEKLRLEHGEFGSGYPSDAKTITFLEEWVKVRNALPSFTRSSWKTWKRITQQTLL